MEDEEVEAREEHRDDHGRQDEGAARPGGGEQPPRPRRRRRRARTARAVQAAPAVAAPAPSSSRVSSCGRTRTSSCRAVVVAPAAVAAAVAAGGGGGDRRDLGLSRRMRWRVVGGWRAIAWIPRRLFLLFRRHARCFVLPTSNFQVDRPAQTYEV